MKPDVTIGIVVRSEQDSLERTLQSLYKNTKYPYGLFIIYDGFCSDTPEILNSFEDVQKITNICEQGIPCCANLLIEQTNTPYLLILESNTYATQSWLTLLINCLKSRPEHGIAGPSTSLAWNEQQIISQSNWSLSEIEAYGDQVEHQYCEKILYLDQLHSISDFCYAFKREVVNRIGYFDERYTKGPCFEIDFSTRAAKAGYRCVWVCGAYVHRFQKSKVEILQETKLFQTNKELYQKKFCGLKLLGKRSGFCDHCMGEACENFARSQQIEIICKKEKKKYTKGYRKTPLVSCIMPTYNRRLFVSQAIKYFLIQDYRNTELVIVDDGIDKVADLIPAIEKIKYISLEQKASVGFKRNIAVEKSRGEVIAHWDDDDWYAKDRISYQIQPLLEGIANVCGLYTGFIYNILENTFWLSDSGLHAMMFYADIHGGSIVYTKDMWEKYAKYPNISVAEDAAFLRALSGKAKIIKLPNKNVFVYIRHGKNAWEFVCGKFINPNGWKRVDPPSFLCVDDLNFYNELSSNL